MRGFKETPWSTVNKNPAYLDALVNRVNEWVAGQPQTQRVPCQLTVKKLTTFARGKKLHKIPLTTPLPSHAMPEAIEAVPPAAE